MGKNLTELHDSYEKRRTNGQFQDFNDYASGGQLTSTLAGSATAAVGNLQGGVLVMSAVDSTANRELYVATTNSFFALTLNKPIIVEAYVQYTEANVNQANVAFGLMSAVGASSLVNTTGVPKASFTGAVIFKVPGGTVWQTCSSVGTVQTTNVSTSAAGLSTYTRLRVEIDPITQTLAEVTYWVDGVQLSTVGGRPGTSFIKDQLTYTGGAAMQLFLGLKNGSTSPEVLNVDYVAWESLVRIFT